MGPELRVKTPHQAHQVLGERSVDPVEVGQPRPALQGFGQLGPGADPSQKGRPRIGIGKDLEGRDEELVATPRRGVVLGGGMEQGQGLPGRPSVADMGERGPREASR